MTPLTIVLCGSIAWLALHIALYFFLTWHCQRQAERARPLRRRMVRYLKPHPWG